jgi:hypothetical protein
MITFRIISNEGIFTSYKTLTKEIKGKLLNFAKDTTIDNLKNYASGKKWKTIGENIRFRISDNRVEIFPSTSKADLMGWLHHGTRAHGPVNAKALHWVKDGTHHYAKWVRGITPTNFFSLNPTIVEKINTYIRKFGK